MSARGFATRIGDIAERAGTSSPAVLYWFATKDVLLDEALASPTSASTRRSTRSSRAGLPARPARQRIASWARRGRRRGGCGWSCGCARCATRRSARPRAPRPRRRAAIADVVREGQAAGEFGPVDADDVALTLGAMMDGLAIQLALRTRQ